MIKINNEEEINKIKNLFEKSINEIEFKIKDIYINNIKVKENLKNIKRIENKKYSLDDILIDKKNELNFLKQLLIIKERKKLNFQEVISKYLSQLILIDNEINKKIDTLNQKNYIVEKKQKIINSLFEDFNNEFENNLYSKKKENFKKNINNTYNYHLLKEKLENEELNLKNTSLISDSDRINKYINRQSFSNTIKNLKKNLLNDKNKFNLNKNKLLKEEKKQNFINEININEEIKDEKDNLDINIIKENKLKRENDGSKEMNDFQNKINFEANKNLKNSRDYLKYLISQNEELRQNKKKREKYESFIKFFFEKIKKYKNNLNKKIFNLLINYNDSLKLKQILNNFVKKNKENIISKIIKVLQNSSQIYNKIKQEEIINDYEFLNKIKNNDNKKNEYTIKDFENNLNEIKNINHEIKDFQNRISIFINKIMEEP